MKYYIVTIRKHQVKDYVSYKELSIVMDRFRQVYPRSYIVSTGVEAHGLYRQLHAHLIVGFTQFVSYKKFNSYFGFYIHFKPITIESDEDMQRCLYYIHKYDWDCDMKRDIIEAENYYNYHYGF